MDNTNLTIFQPSDESIVVYKSTISRHIKNIFDCGELKQDMVVAKNATTTQHGAIHGKTLYYSKWTEKSFFLSFRIIKPMKKQIPT